MDRGLQECSEYRKRFIHELRPNSNLGPLLTRCPCTLKAHDQTEPGDLPMTRREAMTREFAEMLAIDALGFMAEDTERLNRFLAFTGLEAQSLRDAAREPNFLLGVLDHLAADEPLLREFAAHKEVVPELVVKARDVLAAARPATP
jgi:hypothetical protein